MLTVDNVETAGWKPALRGMRNPLNSWDRADTDFNRFASDPPAIGPNDESLMRRLIGQGSPDHCKFRRMLVVYCDVTAPLYWLKEADTYKVGTVMNSCSTMHTIMESEFTEDMFSWESISAPLWKQETINALNHLRYCYRDCMERGLRDKAGDHWRKLIQSLPSSFNQRRTWMLNYEVLSNIYRARRHHKLQEWHQFIDAMVEALPYPWIVTQEGC